ncbi:hypothetical protein [Bacillus haynesii]|uniref:hypothetical protein n=1 Tax=Bacillus haynesii TaxID=1925021 RepID=UPI001F61694C|nr:hypothetical protein [Bacillus haynesii]MCI4127507.1 hypothetical protein [Bacillus haynesii]
MQKVLVLLKNKAILNINQAFFIHSKEKKIKLNTYLIALLFTLCIGVLFLITFLLTDLLIQLFINLTDEFSLNDKLNFIKLLLFSVYIIFAVDGVQNYVSKTLYSKDFYISLYAPIRPGIYLIFRIIEGHIIQTLSWFIVIIALVLNLFIDGVISLSEVPLVLIIFFLYLLSIYITRYFILYIFFKKIATEKKLTNIYISLYTSYFILFVGIIHIIQPLKYLFSNAFFDSVSNWADFSLFLTIHRILTSDFFPTNFFLTMYLDVLDGSYLSFSLYIILIISFLFILIKCLFQRISNSNYLSLLFEVTNKTRDSKVVKKTIKGNFISERILQFGNQITACILLKDLRCLLREKKIVWSAYLFSTAFGYGSIYFIYYIINKQVTLPVQKETIGIWVGVYVVSITVQNLMDRFGVDSELDNIKIYLTAPISSKYLIQAKHFITFVTMVPLIIISCLLSWFLFNANPLITLFVSVISISPFINISLAASIIFPGFNYESIHELPTFKARTLTNLLCLLFLIALVFTWSISNLIISLILITLLCLFTSFLFYRVSKFKLEKRIHF